MADVIAAHSEELLGEPLTLLERKFWIGRYELDLLFSDRHGGKLIVELQRGALDRYHLYKVLDYYDVYKDRHPADFVEVMVVANLISPERKQRLAKRGINYREIPEEVIGKFLQADRPPAAQPTASPQSPVSVDVLSAAPESFRTFLSQFNPWVRGRVRQTLRNLECLYGKDEKYFPFLVGYAEHLNAIGEQVLRSVDKEPPNAQLWEREDDAPFHLIWALGGFPADAFEAAISQVPPELGPLLRLGFDNSEPAHFFSRRKALIASLVRRTTEDPLFLLQLCASLRYFWCENPVGCSLDEAHPFLLPLHMCISDIVQWTSLQLFKTKAVPIGVDENNNFITRPMNLRDEAGSPTVFDHLAWVLALPRNSIVPLWREGECLSGELSEGGFPALGNAFEIGTDLLVNAYGNKEYAVAHPSEVLLQTGEVKSITLLEAPSRSFVYKVRYQDDTISFGYIGVRGGAVGDLTVDHFSTNATIGYLYATPPWTPSNWSTFKPTEAEELEWEKTLTRIGGDEYALVAAIARDFFVCEDREAHYSVQSKPTTLHKPKPGLIIRYLPRFRVRYVGLRDHEYRSQRVEVVGHHVCGHLRRCRTASPLQVVLAKQFNVEVPDGFTFVRPHDREGYDRVLYRSRSALRLVYGANG